MKIFLSIIFGLIFPPVSFMTIGFASDYVPESVLTEIKIYDEPAPGILFAPFSIPVYLEIFARRHRIISLMLEKLLFKATFWLMFDWILYGLVFYFVLGELQKFRNRKVSSSERPPSPPQF